MVEILNNQEKVFSRRDLILGAGTSFLAAGAGLSADDKISGESAQVGFEKSKHTEHDLFDPAIAEKSFIGSEAYQVFLRSAQRNFLNIGVFHRRELLDVQLKKTALAQAIADADIVCLEYGPPNGYFAAVSSFAKSTHSRVINIDRSNNAFSQTWGFISKFWSFARIPKDIKSKDFEVFAKRVMVTLGLSLSAVSPNMFSEISHFAAEKGRRISRFDITNLFDGRTVFMACDIAKIRTENPGKKIISITGDIHAQDIHAYLFTHEGERKVKEFIYNIVYGVFKLASRD